MVPYRETIANRATGERKYVRYFGGRGHFAHLRVEIVPVPGQLPSMTELPDAQLPAECHHAVRAALFKKMHHGPVRGYPLIGIEVRLLSATYLAAYSYPDAFATVACMAFDEALIHAAPLVVEPWIGARLRVEDHALAPTFATLTKFTGQVRAEVSLGQDFIVRTELPLRLRSKVRAALGLRSFETFLLPETQRYRPASASASQEPDDDALRDWT
jgi:elongation factor G